jgi:NAD(P)-dependent dehydrogenase (short-subunit alcohol dehydrogenase family)
VDFLVNAAGENRIRQIADVSEGDFDFVIRVNATAVFFMCQAFGERGTEAGSIVNVSSAAAKAADPQVAVYAGAKAAVLAFTRGFALAYAGRGIRVNAVLPKIIDTPMQRDYVARTAPLLGLSPELLASRRVAEIPLRRAGSASECASVIVFLLSSHASYVTGQSVDVSGGWLMT